MTAKEKATEIIEKYTKDKIIVVMEYAGSNPEYSTLSEKEAKHCALIAVEETIEALEAFGYSGAMYDDFETGQIAMTNEKNPTEYWHQVKKELELL